MSELTNILEESVARLFSEQLDNAVLTTVEESGWPGELWDMVCELGLPTVLLDDDHGGMGGSWSDAYVVVRRCGYASVPLPIPEAIVANWLAAQHELELPDGPAGIIPVTLSADAFSDDRYSGEIARIPWGRDAAYYLGITSAQELVVLGREGVDIECEDNLGHDPRDDVTFSGSPVTHRAATTLPADALRWLCAMLRSAQIAGAGARCLEIGVEFAAQREQFGRPLSRFQAIQHHLAVMAGQLATVEAISAAAFHAMDTYGIGTGGRDAQFEIAAAKCRASDAVEPLTRIAHQVHGAIGFTYEYGLHFYTRRLWSWRAEIGGAGEWAEYLGRIAQAEGGENVWAYITN